MRDTASSQIIRGKTPEVESYKFLTEAQALLLLCILQSAQKPCLQYSVRCN